jgi:MFS family permease
MTTRAIVALGIGQCVNWGVLYYAFGVLLTPLERDLGAPGWLIAGAFSLALLTSALAAPTVGTWIDRGAGPQAVLIGGYAASSLLVLWTALPGLPALFFVWTVLGVCMAATLYEPAFAMIGRAIPTPTARLRALATVTVFGGLASTVFLPLTTLLLESWGWRMAVGILAATLAMSTFVCSRVAGRGSRFADRGSPFADRGSQIAGRGSRVGATADASRPQLLTLVGLFGTVSLATTAFSTTLVPALVAQDLTPLASAWLGGLLGLMQIPGRAVVMLRSVRASASGLVISSLVMQAAGIALSAVAIGRTPLAVAAGITIFAVGAGLMTLARPHLLHTICKVEHVGYANGRVAGAQNVARAGGPILAVGLASVIGYGPTFGILAAVVASGAIACSLLIDT